MAPGLRGVSGVLQLSQCFYPASESKDSTADLHHLKHPKLHAHVLVRNFVGTMQPLVHPQTV